jgi:hypothetical protein
VYQGVPVWVSNIDAPGVRRILPGLSRENHEGEAMSGVYPRPTWDEIHELCRTDEIVRATWEAFQGTVRSEGILILMVVELAKDRQRRIAAEVERRMLEPVSTMRMEEKP